MTRRLSLQQILRIETFRIARRLDIPQLKLAMNAPFTWRTLLRALSREPVQESTYRFLVAWVEKFVPEKDLADGKAAAANDREALCSFE